MTDDTLPESEQARTILAAIRTLEAAYRVLLQAKAQR